jgi:hypothetical protein
MFAATCLTALSGVGCSIDDVHRWDAVAEASWSSRVDVDGPAWLSSWLMSSSENLLFCGSSLLFEFGVVEWGAKQDIENEVSVCVKVPSGTFV